MLGGFWRIFTSDLAGKRGFINSSEAKHVAHGVKNVNSEICHLLICRIVSRSLALLRGHVGWSFPVYLADLQK
jgi:hypothetical protein